MAASAIFMFPGQSSRHPLMLERAIAVAPNEAASVLEEVSSILGRDLRSHLQTSEPFACNTDVQVGVFVTNHIYLKGLEAAGVHATSSLGLSLGEYNHLVHIGALSFADTLRLVNARGAAYDKGPEGAMAAVFPLPLDELSDIVKRASKAGVLDISSLNSPSQNVISGDRAALQEAIKIIDAETYARVVMLDEKIPVHSTLFRPVAEAFLSSLQQAPWHPTKYPYLPNVSAQLIESPSPQALMKALTEHIFRPVLWQRSIELLLSQMPSANFIEVGPGEVLCGLLSRKWCSNARHRAETILSEFATRTEAVNP
jgi:[acyl-carrier-protein] S-malonyltransferase